MIELEELPRKSDESMTGSTGSSSDFDLATASVYNQEEDVLIDHDIVVNMVEMVQY